MFSDSGLEQSYWSGIYATSVGHTGSFGNIAKQLTGLTGVFVGVGEIIGQLILFTTNMVIGQ